MSQFAVISGFQFMDKLHCRKRDSRSDKIEEVRGKGDLIGKTQYSTVCGLRKGESPGITKQRQEKEGHRLS